MKYVQPLGEAEDASYTDGNPTTGVPGSIPTAAAIEHPQREIVNAIMAAGLIPDATNMNQLTAAIQGMITNTVNNYAQADLSNVLGTNVVAKIGANAITETMLADGSVSTAKIAAAAVDGTKLANGSVDGNKLATNSVSTASIADDSVTLAKLSHGTAGKVIGFDQTGAPAELSTSSGIMLQRKLFQPADTSTTSGTWTDAATVNITPLSTSSTFYVHVTCVAKIARVTAGEEVWYGRGYLRTVNSSNAHLNGSTNDACLQFSGQTRADGIDESALESSFSNISLAGNSDLTEKTFKLQMSQTNATTFSLKKIVIMIDEIAN